MFKEETEATCPEIARQIDTMKFTPFDFRLKRLHIGSLV